MEFKEFKAGKDDDGRRLDRVLRIFLKDTGLGEIYKLLRKGLIKVNQKKAKPDSHVNEGDVISIAEFLLDKTTSQNKAENLTDKKNQTELNIVFENEHLLIINKPYGISVHGSSGKENDGLDKQVLAYYQKKYSSNKNSLSFRPGPLHRLDRNTTGLLVFSLSLEGAKWFSEGIKNHIIQKKYLGLVQGRLEEKQSWEDRLSASDKEDESFHTVIKDDEGVLAQTIACPLAYGKLNGKDVSLVEFAIKTGRKHQIRVQSSIHKHPLAGDTAYGAFKITDKNWKREYFLEAYSLSFPPDNPLKMPQEIKIKLSPDFRTIIDYCEIKNPGL